uniref:SHC adaptor protein 1 n=1 Tax=Athene cunicularia TaxID=194338 RepID=A0A663MBP6_ATHCN
MGLRGCLFRQGCCSLVLHAFWFGFRALNPLGRGLRCPGVGSGAGGAVAVAPLVSQGWEQQCVLSPAGAGWQGDVGRLYMGCVEVLQSMRALDFNTRTQVTREAIGLVCEAVPGAKGAVRRRKPCGRSLNSILGKSNLKFAGMPITLTISTSSLNLMASDCKQIIANHHMQSISFASGGDPDTAEYVAYVAKDPVNQRACHILECPEGLAQDVISTIGQAFELRFKQYLKNPPKLVTPHDRMAGFDGSAWDEEEEEPAPDHQYYNDFPGKEPPIGGVVDMRLRDGAAQTPNHLGATLPVGQTSGGDYDPRKQHAPAQAPVGASGRTDLFDDPSYVNVQNMDKTRQASAAGPPATANGSAQRDLFDMSEWDGGCSCAWAGGG